MLLKSCAQYASNFWKLSTSHRSGKSFHPSLKERQCQRMFKLLTIVPISHASKIMLKILQARLQQYVNWELPHVQAGFRKVRGTRGQVANIRWIIENAKEFQKKFYCFTDCAKAFDCVDGSQQTVKNSERDGNTRPPYLPSEKPGRRSRSNS